MKTTPIASIVLFTAGILLQLGTVTALAVPILSFNFSQSGYAGGANVTGSFSGSDFNGDGWLSSFSSEISTYSMSFSGNSVVGAFSHTFNEFFHAGNAGGLVYKLGSALLGDDVSLPIEGISSGALSGSMPPPPPGASQYAYRMGLGPTGVTLQPFGFVEDNTLIGMGNSDVNTTNFVVVTLVSAVPEPGTVILVLAGLCAGLVVCERRNRNAGVGAAAVGT